MPVKVYIHVKNLRQAFIYIKIKKVEAFIRERHLIEEIRYTGCPPSQQQGLLHHDLLVFGAELAACMDSQNHMSAKVMGQICHLYWSKGHVVLVGSLLTLQHKLF